MRAYASVPSIALVSLIAAGCGQGPPPAPTGSVSVSVAPLSLPGITDADYTLTVHNGPDGTGDVVWTRDLSSSSHGDGAGSLSYVGTCDADTGVNTVTLTLNALYDASGVVAVGTYMNPTPISRQLTCVANADVAIDFDLTIAREASQGFFDVAVEFEDVFCSAKLDCENPDGSDLELLHDATGARATTMVLAFACTGRASGPATTYLYMDDPVITCDGQAADVRVDASGVGNLDLTAAPNANPGDYLFGAAVYRGVENLANKAYWNVSFGLDQATLDTLGACRLHARATASADPWPQEALGFPLPAGSVYPVVDWDVLVSDAGGRQCHRHAVNVADSGVTTDYLGYLPLVAGFTWSSGPIYLQHRFNGGNGTVLSAGGPICNPSCAHGSCVAADTCDCTDTGYTGALCDVPVCTTPCENGGSCVAPDTCACLNGFWGAACENACTPVAHCAVPPTCTDATDSSCGACDVGYLPDGAGGCVECLSVDDCSDDANPCTAKACVDSACVQEPGNAGTECRAVAGLCDVAEQCDGVTVDCPTDLFVASGTECRAAGGDCDLAEQCTGSGPSCPADARVPSGTECRAVAGLCDVAEQCDGTSVACPTDAVLPDKTVCRAVAGDCDVEEQCDGVAATCPADALVASGTECRAAVDGCDLAEQCTGGDTACPADAKAALGTACGDASDTVCDNPDTCDGAGTCLANYEPITTECRADAGACDVPESCDGVGSCPPDGFEPDGTACANASFCDGAEQCSGGVCTDQADPCDPATSVCDDGLDQCVPIYASCVDALEAGETVSQLYWIDPDGGGSIPVRSVYCDQVTDGGGWMLMAKFSQNQSIDGLSDTLYNQYFGATGGALWIEGNAMTTPSSTTLEEDNYHVESFAWADYLVSGARYELRQNFFKLAGAATFDAAFRFTYNGHTVQDAVTPEWQRAWQLLDRRVLTDTTGISWDTSDAYHLFWLPFSSNATSTLYTACSSYQFDADGCSKATASARRFGNAGVMGLVADGNDPAGAWAPHMNTNNTYDVVYVHQATATYGMTTGAKMALLYWVREERCTTSADCDSGYCDTVNSVCGDYQASCLDLYGLGQHTDGTYVIDPDGAGGSGAPYAVVCDMTNGGWTRVAYEDFESGTTSGWDAENRVSLCGPGTANTNHIVGGFFNDASMTTYNNKTYSWSHVPHTQARLNIAFYKIDSWDTPETAYIDFGGTNIFAQEYCFCTQTCGAGASCQTDPTPLQCGSSSWNVEVRADVSGVISHTADSVVVHGGATINQANTDESFGLDDVVIWVK